MKLNNKINSLYAASLLAATGALSLVIIKRIASNDLSYNWFIVPLLINILSIYLVFIGLKSSSITIFNIEWNLISNILVTGVGVSYLKEINSINQIIGLILAFISIIILNFEDIIKIFG